MVKRFEPWPKKDLRKRFWNRLRKIGEGNPPHYKFRYIPSLKLTAKAPRNGWLEYYFPIEEAYFQGLCWFQGGYKPCKFMANILPYQLVFFSRSSFLNHQQYVLLKSPQICWWGFFGNNQILGYQLSVCCPSWKTGAFFPRFHQI